MWLLALERSADCVAKDLDQRVPSGLVSCAGHPDETFVLERTDTGLRVSVSDELGRGRASQVELVRADPVALALDVGPSDVAGSPELAWVGGLSQAAMSSTEFGPEAVRAALEHRGVDPSTVSWRSVRRMAKRTESLVFRMAGMAAEDQQALIQESVDAELR